MNKLQLPILKIRPPFDLFTKAGKIIVQRALTITDPRKEEILFVIVNAKT